MSKAMAGLLVLSKAKIYVIVELWRQFLTQHRGKMHPSDCLIPFLNNFYNKNAGL